MRAGEQLAGAMKKKRIKHFEMAKNESKLVCQTHYRKSSLDDFKRRKARSWPTFLCLEKI